MRLIAVCCRHCTTAKTIGHELTKFVDACYSAKPHIGYDKLVKSRRKRMKNCTLREEVVNLGYMKGEEFDKAVIPEEMVGKL